MLAFRSCVRNAAEVVEGRDAYAPGCHHLTAGVTKYGTRLNTQGAVERDEANLNGDDTRQLHVNRCKDGLVHGYRATQAIVLA